VCSVAHCFASGLHSEQNEVRSLLAHLLPNHDQVDTAILIFLPNVFLTRCSFSQGLIDAQFATVDEVVAFSHAAPAAPEDGSVLAVLPPAAPCRRTSHRTPSSSSSSDFVLLSNDSDSDFVVREEGTS
jgi:hypothetical protein